MSRLLPGEVALSVVKSGILLLIALVATAAAAEKKKPSPAAPLPEKGLPIEDALSLDKLLDPGSPVPDILPAPEAIPAAPKGTAPKPTNAASAKAALISAANDYRRDTTLYRKGKLTREALKTSAVRVAESARTYRASLRRN